jgi:hypothetical protein
MTLCIQSLKVGLDTFVPQKSDRAETNMIPSAGNDFGDGAGVPFEWFWFTLACRLSDILVLALLFAPQLVTRYMIPLAGTVGD